MRIIKSSQCDRSLSTDNPIDGRADDPSLAYGTPGKGRASTTGWRGEHVNRWGRSGSVTEIAPARCRTFHCCGLTRGLHWSHGHLTSESCRKPTTARRPRAFWMLFATRTAQATDLPYDNGDGLRVCSEAALSPSSATPGQICPTPRIPWRSPNFKSYGRGSFGTEDVL